jgi:hypothetical protein
VAVAALTLCFEVCSQFKGSSFIDSTFPFVRSLLEERTKEL